MITRADICAEALRWVGTPYKHQACLRGIGVDCAMLLAGIGKALGLVPLTWQYATYSPEWHLHQSRALLAEQIVSLGGTEIDVVATQPGDILLMRYGRTASHAGILMPGAYMIHASLPHWAVVHHGFVGEWRERWVASYAYPGVAV